MMFNMMCMERLSHEHCVGHKGRHCLTWDMGYFFGDLGKGLQGYVIFLSSLLDSLRHSYMRTLE